MMRHVLFIWTLAFFITASLHANTNTTATKNQLNSLSNKIGAIEHNLSTERAKQQALSQNLALTEKKLSQEIVELHNIQQEIIKKKSLIESTQHQITGLEATLKTQQETLANHLRARYLLGKNQPMMPWIFNQNNPSKLNQQMTSYQYILKADLALMNSVKDTMQTLTDNQTMLNEALSSLLPLENKARMRQNTLMQMKSEHQHLIATMSKTITTKEQTLNTYRRDQERLQAVLKHLSSTPQKRMLTHTASINLTPNLTNPLQGKASRATPLNQGIIFFAKEGLSVHAVLPGQVVFSDWLKGYGLLMIIDHGNGLMSLYAHNEALFKNKHQAVKKGEKIATVGHTGGVRENGLYFELRRRGKVVPPRQWLA
ncbi:MAG: murein hydrolase activator EnvC family protein [Legionellaceae bacterium]